MIFKGNQRKTSSWELGWVNNHQNSAFYFLISLERGRILAILTKKLATATITLNPHHRSILILRMFLHEQEKEKIL